MKILLVTPPFIHCNTPYPATPYLAGFLKKRGHDAVQADASLMLLLRLFTRTGMEEVFAHLPAESSHPGVRSFRKHAAAYAMAIDPVIRFLQNRDPSLAHRIVTRGFLPEGPRFNVIKGYEESLEGGLDLLFGAMGTTDRAVHLATLFLDDVMDTVTAGIDPYFGIERYGEYLSSSFGSFDPLERKLEGRTLIDGYMDDIAAALMQRHAPQMAGFTVPFPGCLYGALRLAQAMKRHDPSLVTVMGGGYPSTELRSLTDTRLFKGIDHVVLDDGMQPILSIIDGADGKVPARARLRTFSINNGAIEYASDPDAKDVPFSEWETPDYTGLDLDSYFVMNEMANPMFRLWNGARWNKMLVAHGCYWHQCSFCDTSLDYICRYETAPAQKLVDQMARIMDATGQSGFHFVDEAAPPAVLASMAELIVKRGMGVTWWGNIRFDKAFTAETVRLLAQSGCVAVTGGLEAMSERLLKVINKGVSLPKLVRMTRRFTDAGIMVHAYLMYGVPTETVQETVDALERVRQLFEHGCIHSAHWHRFSVTVHSTVGICPQEYGITLTGPADDAFARNDAPFVDPTGVDHAVLGVGLHKATYNYMHGIGIERDVRTWFDVKVPKTQVPKDEIEKWIG